MSPTKELPDLNNLNNIIIKVDNKNYIKYLYIIKFNKKKFKLI